jgi:SWI/SNF-related matrix-associated actin-dependent regulator of chromatin subfamily A member 5
MRRKRFALFRDDFPPPTDLTYLCGQQTNVTNLKREARDKARKKWLYCHRTLIKPLLPSNSGFFDNLEKEIGMWGEEQGVSFVPLHELDEQPILVKGGYMKDYQVRSFSLHLRVSS